MCLITNCPLRMKFRSLVLAFSDVYCLNYGKSRNAGVVLLRNVASYRQLRIIISEINQDRHEK